MPRSVPARSSAGPRLTSAASRLLRRLADRGPAHALRPDGGAGPAASALLAAGLARAGGDGRLAVTPEGLARLRRDAAPGDIAFLAQHRPLSRDDIGEGRDRRQVLVDAAESPLAWLRRRRGPDGRPMLDDALFSAGERFRADVTRAAMLPRVTADWSGLPRGSGAGPGEAADLSLAARERVGRALRAAGDDLAGVLLDVCGFLKGLEEVERERGWPPRSGKVVLLIGLGRLADHYGMRRAATGPAVSRGIRAWAGTAEP